MVNTEAFTKRLQEIINFYDLSAASFADSIEVGRSTISHLLSGRNKPSLDFVLKIEQKYPEVELYWLLNGKGKFPASSASSEKPPEKSSEKKVSENTLVSSLGDFEIKQKIRENKSNSGRLIQKIVIFYEDGTFEAFEN